MISHFGGFLPFFRPIWVTSQYSPEIEPKTPLDCFIPIFYDKTSILDHLQNLGPKTVPQLFKILGSMPVKMKLKKLSTEPSPDERACIKGSEIYFV